MHGTLPELPDVWARVELDDLPRTLAAAFRQEDWVAVHEQLRTVMDGSITDGPFGRALLQLVLALPSGLDPVFDEYRLAAMLDHGDWDGLRGLALGERASARVLRAKRDILTAAVDQSVLPREDDARRRMAFEITEYQASNSANGLRKWSQRISGQHMRELWERDDIAVGRHLRLRQLHDCVLLAQSEAVGGRLPVSHALASEATRLGDAREPLRTLADDLVELTRRAMGDNNDFQLAMPARVCEATGPSPLGTGEMLLYELPLLPLLHDGSLAWSARLLGYIASRLASPRWQLQAESWRVADQLHSGMPANKTELAALDARSRRATPGLRALPIFLAAYATRRSQAFEEAERLARRSGNVWLQISALTWSMALDPRQQAARYLRVLLDMTGWRRPVLVPTEIAADAALGMTAQGERSESVLELALLADRPNVTTELIRRYLEDAETPPQLKLAAIDALARVGTTHAREILSRLALRRDDIGKAAASAQQRPGVGLSEREIEVLSLAADGLTNKQIGEKLFLSHHTIARHLANARAKLGASNRAEAAVRLHRAGVD